jgi:hypothetical protein
MIPLEQNRSKNMLVSTKGTAFGILLNLFLASLVESMTLNQNSGDLNRETSKTKLKLRPVLSKTADCELSYRGYGANSLRLY